MHKRIEEAPTPKRRRLRIAIYMVCSLLAAIVFGVVILLWEKPLPPLAVGLSDTVAVAVEEFERRVRETFPLESSEDDLVRELSRQGFRPQWRRKDDDNVAVLERSSLICRESWLVAWRADRTGKITKIKGRFGLTCL